ncbi:MAG: hypothetical protein M0C28_25675 [Candidatus Moduliflexus flocculans]|nr:hypothetical protein [Candidatus Moduliflexus flocculans]
MTAYARSKAVFERAARVIPGGIYGSKSAGLPVTRDVPVLHRERLGVPDVGRRRQRVHRLPLRLRLARSWATATTRSTRAGLERSAHGDLLDQPAPVMVGPGRAPGRTGSGARTWAVFAKNGTDATTLALSLARVTTGKRGRGRRRRRLPRGGQLVRVEPLPRAGPRTRADMRPFRYNDLEGLERRLRAEPRTDVACVILTPYHHPDLPAPGPARTPSLYDTVRRLCDAEGALLGDGRHPRQLPPPPPRVATSASAPSPTCGCMGKALANG